MSKTIEPFLNLACANLSACCRFMQAPEYTALWRESIDNYARFSTECTQCMLTLPLQNYSLMNNLMDSVSHRTEEAASHVAHASIRAVAIATQARKQNRDRRVLRVPLPEERRTDEKFDRRHSAGFHVL